MLAIAFLTAAVPAEHAGAPDPQEQIPLTRDEIASLLASLATTPRPTPGTALIQLAPPSAVPSRKCHYQLQATQSP